MNLAEFKKQLVDPGPLYQLSGGDVFLRDAVFQMARGQIADEARSFDWGVHDLEDAAESEVVGEARTLPWMSPKRWIYVRNAHLAGAELKACLKNPARRTVMILELARKPSGWPRIPTIRDDAGSNVAAWIKDTLRRQGFEIEAAAARSLVELVGEDRHRLRMELDKLVLNCAESRRVDRASVLALARESAEYDVFALIGCLARREDGQALAVLNRLFDQGLAAPQILSLLYWNFRRLLVARERLEGGAPFSVLLRELKIWSYRGRRRELEATPRRHLVALVLKVREADRMCKSTAVDERLILERLVVDACR